MTSNPASGQNLPVSTETMMERWYASRKPALDGAAQPVTASGLGMRIAIQGEPGSFSHEAALKLVADASVVPCALSADVFAALKNGTVDAAAIPIENCLAGSVLEHFDLLLMNDVTVVRETQLHIRHNLIVVPGTKIEAVERVFSHPVALAQCKRFLAEHEGMRSYAFYDTAGSVKQLMELGDRNAAAIASEAAAHCYGAEILRAHIEDNPENYTRFFLVRRAAEATTDPRANKISVAFALEHRPGTLVSALSELAAIGTNLTKIESRPVMGKPWEYIFYVDCLITSMDQAERAIAALSHHCTMVKELGRYCEEWR
jgi:prephenate dehydratase